MTTISTLYDSPVGPVTLSSDGKELIALRLGVPASVSEEISVFAPAIHWLDLYFSGREPGFVPPIKLVGTDFQQRVWRALLDIHYGHTTTYGALARRIGCRSAQAVGQAVGHNPIAIIIPCHRVIGSDGLLTGYAYGVDCKKYLLDLEAKYAQTTTTYNPQARTASR